MTFECIFRHVEFRYDLGTGAAVIRTPTRIKLGRWHRLQAKRWHRDGMLKLDNHEEVEGHSAGVLRSLDLEQPTYVGGIPYEMKSNNMSVIAANLGLRKVTGLEGCIRRFKLGYKEVKIGSASEPRALRRVSLQECEMRADASSMNACGHRPCLNGGSCFVLPPALADIPYRCDCKHGFTGQRCQEISKPLNERPVSNGKQWTHQCCVS